MVSSWQWFASGTRVAGVNLVAMGKLLAAASYAATFLRHYTVSFNLDGETASRVDLHLKQGLAVLAAVAHIGTP